MEKMKEGEIIKIQNKTILNKKIETKKRRSNLINEKIESGEIKKNII
jgi:hypothetical protein